MASYLNNYAVHVLGSRELPGGYVELEHGQKYKFNIRNNNDLRADAEVYIDGKPVGTWRLNAHSNLTLERPAHDESCFTFYLEGTTEARQAQLADGSSELGLIKVVFTPEVKVKPIPIYHSSYTVKANWSYIPPYTTTSVTGNYASASNDLAPMAMAAMPSSRAGGTGLSGHSDQKFTGIAPLNYDYSQQTTIYLRLVGKSDTPKPLTSNATPIPPRI